MQKISVVIPAYKSEKTLPVLVKRIHDVMESNNYLFEVIIVDDASPDNTWKVLTQLKIEYDFLKIVRLMINIGQHKAILCGFSLVEGDIIITMDDDLQNPPEEIPILINELNKGYDLVIGSYLYKQHTITKNLFGSLIDYSQKRIFNLPKNFKLTSFRAIRRNVVNNISQMNSVYPYITSMLLDNTSKIANVQVEHHPRLSGKSNYTFKRGLSLALNLWLNYSSYPLYLVILLCLFSFIFTIGFALYVIWLVIMTETTSGWASLIVTISFFNALILLCLVVHSVYLSRINNKNFNFPIGEYISSQKNIK
jgi:glycosyltransferase involved in cell wall biosynthesis